jgi:hypothetical protein
MPPKELRCHLKHYMGASLIASYFVLMLYFRAKKRVDAGGPCLGVKGRPSVLSNKSLDDLKRTAKIRDLGQNSFTEVQLMDSLTKGNVAEQKAARCASSSSCSTLTW